MGSRFWVGNFRGSFFSFVSSPAIELQSLHFIKIRATSKRFVVSSNQTKEPVNHPYEASRVAVQRVRAESSSEVHPDV